MIDGSECHVVFTGDGRVVVVDVRGIEGIDLFVMRVVRGMEGDAEADGEGCAE